MTETIEFIAVLLLFLWSVSVWSALMSLSPGRIRRIEEQDKNTAELLEKWFRRRSEYEIILRFIIFFTAGVITVHSFIFYAKIFENTPPYLTALLSSASTFVLLLATEVSAGTFGYFLDLAVLKISMPLIHTLRKTLFMPVVGTAMAIRKKIYRMKNTHDNTGNRASAEDEILSIVENNINDSANNIEKTEREMIKGVFNLDNTMAREIMTPRVDILGIPLNADIQKAKQKIIESGHSRMPVYEDSIDKIIGIIYAKDMLDEEKIKDKNLSQILRQPIFVPENKSVKEILEEFKRKSNHFAVVVDEYGGTAGIITFEDVIEEILGEIGDEYDTQEDILPDNTVLPDGSVIFDGRVLTSDVNVMFDGAIEEVDGVDTIGGYISAKLGRIPESGEKFDLNNALQVSILKSNNRKISKLKISKKR